MRLASSFALLIVAGAQLACLPPPTSSPGEDAGEPDVFRGASVEGRRMPPWCFAAADLDDDGTIDTTMRQLFDEDDRIVARYIDQTDDGTDDISFFVHYADDGNVAHIGREQVARQDDAIYYGYDNLYYTWEGGDLTRLDHRVHDVERSYYVDTLEYVDGLLRVYERSAQEEPDEWINPPPTRFRYEYEYDEGRREIGYVFDRDVDGTVDYESLTEWEGTTRTHLGDTDLDGEFDDFRLVNHADEQHRLIRVEMDSEGDGIHDVTQDLAYDADGWLVLDSVDSDNDGTPDVEKTWDYDLANRESMLLGVQGETTVAVIYDYNCHDGDGFPERQRLPDFFPRE